MVPRRFEIKGHYSVEYLSVEHILQDDTELVINKELKNELNQIIAAL